MNQVGHVNDKDKSLTYSQNDVGSIRPFQIPIAYSLEDTQTPRLKLSIESSEDLPKGSSLYNVDAHTIKAIREKKNRQ